MNKIKKKERLRSEQNSAVTLTNKIREALLALQKKQDSKCRYATITDNNRVFRRSILKAIHDVIFDEYINTRDVVSEEIDILLPRQNGEWHTICSEFCTARRDFEHDTKRLDNGLPAELILAPIDQEYSEEKNGQSLISYKRKLLLMSLLIIECKVTHKTEEKRIEDVSHITGIPKGSLRTRIRDLRASQKSAKKGNNSKAKFTPSELQYYSQLQDTAIKILKSKATPKSIGQLYMPALMAFAKANPHE